MKYQDHNDKPIGDIIYLTGLSGDTPISNYVIRGTEGDRIWLNRKDVTLIRNFSSQPQQPLDERFTKRVKKITFWTGTFVKSKAYQPDVIISGDDSETPRKYGYDFDIVELPGHTLGSMGILKGDTLYCGDAFVIFNGEPSLPVHAASLELMSASAEKIRVLAPRFIACGHGLPTECDKISWYEN